MNTSQSSGKAFLIILSAFFCLVSLMSIMYAFVQKSEADRLRDRTESIQREAEFARDEAEQRRLEAVQALEFCQQSKK